VTFVTRDPEHAQAAAERFGAAAAGNLASAANMAEGALDRDE